MATDMSSQGSAGLSNPSFGAKAPVQEGNGFAFTGEQSGSNTIDAGYAQNPGSAFAAQDVSTQGNAGFNAEGSYESNGESNAYPESENM